MCELTEKILKIPGVFLYEPDDECLNRMAKEISDDIDREMIHKMTLFAIKEKIARGEDLTEAELGIVAEEI